MLLCDFGNLAREVERLADAGAPALHLDVMDGHFVPNLTYGLTLVETFRRLTDLPLDVHLMISNPGSYIDRYIQAGADSITVHIEAVPQPGPLLEHIRALGAAAGIALNPRTPLETIEPALEACDLVLVMSVEPGFGGQAFEPVALEKLKKLRERLPLNVLLEVDGGVNETTIQRCAEAGAQLFVTGSAIFKQADYAASIERLTGLTRYQGALTEEPCCKSS
jgi:ribulose-phosphate 3-epimerase